MARSRRSPRAGISGLHVQGFKSLMDPTDVEIRPLTVLAGANSSGKSSVMQPLLLLKQTLEASYDPGPLRIDGPNVEFTAVEQFISRLSAKKDDVARELRVGVRSSDEAVSLTFGRGVRARPVELREMAGLTDGDEYVFRHGMAGEDLVDQVPRRWRNLFPRKEFRERAQLQRNRCFFELGWSSESPGQSLFFPAISVSGGVDALIRGVIHIPGLRGNPERLYPVTAVGTVFPGQFQTYVASVISQASGDLVQGLGDDLRVLGLTWKVRAAPISDTQVEIQVGRLTQAQQGGAQDLVSIADVGLGVSQVLPILVALRVARPGQLVIVEQPEIHLHPHAQVELARLVGAAIRRGVRVVIETHSDLMVLAFQTLVAEESVEARDVILHWFTREPGGRTVVKSNSVDEAGSFGDWPEDFADVQLSAKDEYLNAAEPKMRLFED